MTDRHEVIRESYRQLGGKLASFYDGMITCTRPLGKLFNRMIWGFDEASTAEWINGALIFDNATLLTIANELSRRYSVNIVIASENLRSTRFYCYFVGKDFTLDDILKSLESTGKVKCRKENGLIRFQ